MDCAECEAKNCIACDNEYSGKRSEYIAKYMAKNREIVENSCKVTSETNAKANRVEELMLFSKKMGYTHLGIAFCKGLSKQAKKLSEMLKSEGFKVTSVCCKICEIDKSEIGAEKIIKTNAPEIACNPYAQADVLNAASPDLTVTVGFCMGHDILFYQNIKTPVTPLIVKDRVHGHNPAETLRLSNM